MTSFQQLTQKLIDSSQPIATRRAAVLKIAEIGGDQAFPFLIDALCDNAPGVRREAANALQQYNSEDATPALLDAIKTEENDLTLWTLIEVMGNVGTATALPDLKDLLSTTLSPLTRREIQKSIVLITARHQATETAELSETTRDDFSDKSGSIDSIQTPHMELEQSESSQDSSNGSVEVEVFPDDSATESDDRLDEEIVPSYIVEEDSDSEHIDVSVIDLVEQHDQESGEATHDDLTGTEVVSHEPNNSTQEETDSVHDLEEIRSSLTILGSSPTLPVLVPNTSVVIYGQEKRIYKPSTFAIMLRPNAYLSKLWVSRTRLYLVLFCLLVGATVALVYSQVQRRPRSPYTLNAEIAYMENRDTYLSAGIFFIQEGDYRSAIETLEFIRGVDLINPELIDLYRYLGFAYFQENQYALSVESYEYYLKRRKIKTSQLFVAEASYTSISLSDDNQDSSDYKTYNILGTAYARLGHLNNAKKAYETAIKIAPNEAEAYSNLAQLYTDGYQQKHLLTEALAYAAVRLNPDVASNHDTLGWIFGKSGRLQKATNTLEQAIRLQRDYVPAHYHLTEVAQKSKHPNKGLKVVQKDLINKIRPTTKSRSDMLDVLSYIYETDAQRIPRLTASLLNIRGIKR